MATSHKYNPDAPLLTADDLAAAYSVVRSSNLVCRTPVLADVDPQLLGLPADPGYRVHLKLESAQLTGSFKPRGIAVQLERLTAGLGAVGDASTCPKLVTMSAGNYGRSFADACRSRGLRGLVVMPETAPPDRVEAIRSLGAQVETCPTSELQARVDEKVANEGCVYLHSFDDTALIAGHASLGLELMEQLPQVDAVILGCGGGGLSAGVAAALRLTDERQLPARPRRVFAVEPETANSMRLSFDQGSPARLPTARSVAAGLAPPYAGTNTYRHLRHFGAEVVVVSDAQIRASQRRLARSLGLLVEASACAGLAALRSGAVGAEQLEGCRDVCVVLTGRNAPPAELAELLSVGANCGEEAS